jgi:hypothetical protein
MFLLKKKIGKGGGGADIRQLSGTFKGVVNIWHLYSAQSTGFSVWFAC